MKLYIDFETRSHCNLLTNGAHKYAADPTTEVIVQGFAVDDSPVQTGKLEQGIIDDVDYIVAWNAQFERLLLPKLGLKAPLEKFYCVATQARNCNLPGALADASYVLGKLGLTSKKLEGNSLIRLFSIPEYETAETRPEEWSKFVDYCKQDVQVMREIHKQIKPLTEWELAEYHNSERINDRGIMVDVPMCQGGVELVRQLEDEMQIRICDVTQGQLTKTRGTKVTKWVYDNLPENLKPLMHSDLNKSGIALRQDNLDVLLSALRSTQCRQVKEVLDILNNVGGNAVKKFYSFVNRADDKGIARGSYLHCGTHTGRYSSVGVQLQNLPRNKVTIPREIDKRDFYYAVRGGNLEKVNAICNNYGLSVVDNIKGLVRHAIMARPGKHFFCVDWEQIEGRIAPWLADNKYSQDKLEAYADPDRDVYCETASIITGRQIIRQDPERQSYGKTCELALGYGGSTGALETMCRLYGVELPAPERVVDRWRKANKWAVVWWRQVVEAALAAYDTPGKEFPAGRVTFQYLRSYLKGTLLCKLPSGRYQHYPFCRVEEDEYGRQLVSIRSKVRPKVGERGWPGIRLWHGVLCENITQATAGCLLRNRLTALSRYFTVVGHTHDEILFELKDEAEHQIIKDLCTVSEGWWEGLPLSVDSWIGTRFQK